MITALRRCTSGSGGLRGCRCPLSPRPPFPRFRLSIAHIYKMPGEPRAVAFFRADLTPPAPLSLKGEGGGDRAGSEAPLSLQGEGGLGGEVCAGKRGSGG